MIKRMIDFIGDIRVTFWLLLGIAAVMFAGSLYFGSDLNFFRGMNGPRIQDWFFSQGITRVSRTWWVPLLFAIFALLWINLAVCAAKRISSLWPRRRTLPVADFIHVLIPSYVHIIFLLILAAHFITFTLGSQEIIPIQQGGSVTISNGALLQVMDISHEYYPEDSPLKSVIRQSTVTFDCVGNGKVTRHMSSFTNPVYVDGNWIMIDMKKPDRKKAAETGHSSCEQVHHNNIEKAAEPPVIFFVITRDPGLILLVICFVQIIIAMGWYYYRMNGRKA